LARWGTRRRYVHFPNLPLSRSLQMQQRASSSQVSLIAITTQKLLKKPSTDLIFQLLRKKPTLSNLRPEPSTASAPPLPTAEKQLPQLPPTADQKQNNNKAYGKLTSQDNEAIAQAISSAKQSNKRLFSNRESTIVSPTPATPAITDSNAGSGANTYAAPVDSLHKNDSVEHSEKRPRASNWPLSHPSTNTKVGNHDDGEAIDLSYQPQPSRKGMDREGSYSPPRDNSSPRPKSARGIRPSRFMEGSMNNKVSTAPMREFAGEEDEDGWRGRGRDAVVRGSREVEDRAQSMVRNSGIFRFGKSLVAGFNPSNWKIFNKQEKEETEMVEEKLKREDREKMQKAYAEWKKNGPVETGRRAHKRAASQDVDCDGSGRKERRYGRIFTETPDLTSYAEGEGYPSSNGHASKPSSTRSRSRSTEPRNSLGYSHGNASRRSLPATAFTTSTATLHRIPSRKALQVQQKLLHRVSNLENQLEKARRQLAEAQKMEMDDNAFADNGKFSAKDKGRKRFGGGGLPTLKSESLLSGHVQPSIEADDHEMDDEDAEQDIEEAHENHRHQIGMAVSTDAKVIVSSNHSSYEIPASNVARRRLSFSNPIAPPQPQREAPRAMAQQPTPADSGANSVASASQSVESLHAAITTLSDQPEYPDIQALPEKIEKVQQPPSDQPEYPDHLDRPKMLSPQLQEKIPEIPDPSMEAAVTSKRLKKRKSAGNEDDAVYKPSRDSDSNDEEEEEEEQVAKKPSPAKKRGRPRKLQKMEQADPKVSKTTAEDAAAQFANAMPAAISAGTNGGIEGTKISRKLSKDKNTTARQTASRISRKGSQDEKLGRAGSKAGSGSAKGSGSVSGRSEGSPSVPLWAGSGLKGKEREKAPMTPPRQMRNSREKETEKQKENVKDRVGGKRVPSILPIPVLSPRGDEREEWKEGTKVREDFEWPSDVF
jgi:hypothetical protein